MDRWSGTSPLASFYPPCSRTIQLDPLGPTNSCSIQESSAIEMSSLILLSAYNFSSQALDETLSVALVDAYGLYPLFI
jgi:hypothetical protein